MTVRDISVESKHVLMRVDFNVPMANGVVTDDKRIKAALPTIEYVIGQGGSLVLRSHLGRPKGTGFEPDFSLRAASETLATLLGTPVQMARDCVGPDVEAMAKAPNPGDASWSKTHASTTAKKRTTSTWRGGWPRWATCLSTTPLARRT